MTQNTKTKRESRIFLFILLCVTAAVVALALLFPALTGRGGSEVFRRSLVEIPTVSAMVPADDGSMNNVALNVTLEVEAHVRDDVDATMMQLKITEIMGTLNYDRLRGENAAQYLRSGIEAGLADYIDPADFRGVHITDMQTGGAIGTAPLPSVEQSRNNNVWRGLFRNLD